ncbi:dihydroneopterin aldolase [Flavobacteriaceae bacterium]|nr:dihydroneopterin aldolase [Flavobacteriaceae bacterium]MDC1310015.1 dihydroneopterin aldolase [Flavobacteriaceae bacterium]
MGIVKVTDLLVYGYHGCLKEESIIGSEYLINIKAWTNVQKAAKSDSLVDAVDYVLLSDIAQVEMKKRGNLLESVVDRIVSESLKRCSNIKKIKVCLAKLNPPTNSDAKSVSVSLTRKSK